MARGFVYLAAVVDWQPQVALLARLDLARQNLLHQGGGGASGALR